MGGCSSTKSPTARDPLKSPPSAKSSANPSPQLSPKPSIDQSVFEVSGNVMRLISQELEVHGPGKKWEIDSKPDQEGAEKGSFLPKNVEQLGEVADPGKAGIGFVCRKGMKPEHPQANQDSWLVLKVEGDFTMYGVFDGHGKCGHDVSDYVKEQLPKIVLLDPRFKTNLKEVLREAFPTMQAMLSSQWSEKDCVDAERSGTTATVAVHDHAKQLLTVAHVGDSSACLARIRRQGTAKDLVALELTKEHKPEDKHEKAHVEKHGGRVEWDGTTKYRVYARDQKYPGLAMTRCLGDILGHKEAGLSCVPDVSEHKINGDDLMVLLCSDGIWEFVNAQEAVGFFREALPGLSPFQGARRLQHWNRVAPPCMMSSAEKLAKHAYDRWIQEAEGSMVDDITVVAALLKPSLTTPSSKDAAALSPSHEEPASTPPPHKDSLESVTSSQDPGRVRIIESI